MTTNAKPSVTSVLRSLHAARQTDREIADALGPPWTKRRVRHLRSKLNPPLPAVRAPRKEFRSPFEAREAGRRCYARRWLHLLPQPANTDDRDPDPVTDDKYTHTRTLSRREVDILNALSDHGPQTRAVLVARCRIPRRALSGRTTYFGRLQQLGLIRAVGMGTAPDGRESRLYELAPGIAPRMPTAKKLQQQPAAVLETLLFIVGGEGAH